HLDGKDRALARTGTDMDSVAQQVRQALYNGQTKAEALNALARRIVKLMEIPENRFKFLFGNADPAVPDLNAHLVAAPAAAQQDLALIGVFHSIREQVADHLLEQAWIAVDAEAARDDTPAEVTCRRVKSELRPQVLEHGIDRETDHLSADNPGLQLVDVKECVQHARHSAHGLVESADQAQRGFILELLRQHLLEQADRLQRLAQIMAGGSEEPRLAEIGVLGLPLGGLQRLRHMLAFGDVFDRQQDLSRGQGLVADLQRAHEQRSHSPRRQLDLDFVILDDWLAEPEAVEVAAQRRDIEAAIIDRVELSAHGLLRLDRKGAVEGAARGDDVELLIEHDERLTNGVDDAVGIGPRCLDCPFGGFSLGYVGEGDNHPRNLGVVGAVGQNATGVPRSV